MKKVLIADDAVFVRQLVKVKLEHFGLQVIEGIDGEEALHKAIEEQPDLILLDVMMPKMNGFETCHRLKEHPATSHIPILMLTARGEQMDQEKGKSVGVVEYMTKPFSPQKLAERVLALLGNEKI
jgi:DNA-binding response OmpR family regulator